jgi:hypothetical protein
MNTVDLTQPSLPDYDFGRLARQGDEEKHKFSAINPLVLSVTWKRLRDSQITNTVYSLTSAELIDYVTEDDHKLANEIRDFYSKKIMLIKLTGATRPDGTMSAFREDLNTFIHNTSETAFSERTLGLVFYLPSFYEHDIALRDIKRSVGCVPKDYARYDNITSVLIPIRMLRRDTRGKKINQYWFKEVESNNAYMFEVTRGNELEPVWKNIFTKSNSITINGMNVVKCIEDFRFFSPKKWELVSTD